MMQPLLASAGTLPNGERFSWSLLPPAHVAGIVTLQDAVAQAASDLEKTFLIQRTEQCFHDSMSQGHLYWGATVGNKVVALFGLADNDEEVGDGRGHKTPKNVLGVSDYTQVSILKGAQVHPRYRDQGLGALGALSRYLHFTANPDKRVIMTKVSAHNAPVCENYLKNGFIKAFETTVNDRGFIFDVVTFMAERDLLERFVADKQAAIIKRFALTAAN